MNTTCTNMRRGGEENKKAAMPACQHVKTGAKTHVSLCFERLLLESGVCFQDGFTEQHVHDGEAGEQAKSDESLFVGNVELVGDGGQSAGREQSSFAVERSQSNSVKETLVVVGLAGLDGLLCKGVQQFGVRDRLDGESVLTSGLEDNRFIVIKVGDFRNL